MTAPSPAPDIVERLRGWHQGGGRELMALAAAEIERLRASERNAVVEWQDIATAPKDGCPLLLFSEVDGVEFGKWDIDTNADWRHDPGGWPIEATHWMPLPPAPRALATAPPTPEGETEVSPAERLRELLATSSGWPLLFQRAELQAVLDRVAALEAALLEANEALSAVVRVADRKTVEFDAARAAITKCRATLKAAP